MVITFLCCTNPRVFGFSRRNRKTEVRGGALEPNEGTNRTIVMRAAALIRMCERKDKKKCLRFIFRALDVHPKCCRTCPFRGTSLAPSPSTSSNCDLFHTTDESTTTSFVVICRLTSFCVLIPTSKASLTSERCAELLLSHVFGYFGFPSQIQKRNNFGQRRTLRFLVLGNRL